MDGPIGPAGRYDHAGGEAAIDAAAPRVELERQLLHVADDSDDGRLQRDQSADAARPFQLVFILPAGHTNSNPAGNTPIEPGDVLIALGEGPRLKELERMLEA